MYNSFVTTVGRELIARILAEDGVLTLNRVVFGDGVLDESMNARALTGLINPIAEGTSTIPVQIGDSLEMVVEYRNDLNGGLQSTFTINEFGIFAIDPDGAEIMLYYATLASYPQTAIQYRTGLIDIHRYPVVISFGDGGEVQLVYTANAFMTAEDVETYCHNVCIPAIREIIAEMIDEHDQDPNAHSGQNTALEELRTRIRLLELRFDDTFDGTFETTFADLGDCTVTGTWNVDQARVEF